MWKACVYVVVLTCGVADGESRPKVAVWDGLTAKQRKVLFLLPKRFENPVRTHPMHGVHVAEANGNIEKNGRTRPRGVNLFGVGALMPIGVPVACRSFAYSC